jgi:hypothetical protein
MTPERWQRLEELFHAMLALPSESRAASLSAACGDDVEMRVEVQRLLQADAHASAFVDGAAAGLERVAATVLPDGAPIGAYRVVRELGRGGMGTVYLGERADAQFEMRAAIKVIKRGMDSDAVNLVRRQPAEKFQLDDPAFSRICFTETLERLVQIDDVHHRSADFLPDERQRHVLGAAATLVRDAIPCVIDEDATHHHGRESHELRAIRPVHFPLIQQPHIGFVHEGRRLQCVTRPLATQVARG